MTDPHEAKYNEMQKYVPFIQRVIEKLKVNNDHQEDNPRKAQLQKMEMLHDLLTNKHKKIKIETLIKCESVLIKLQTKLEKNDDPILSDVIMKPQTTGKPSRKDTKDQEEDFGPASPPPEVLTIDEIDQPIVIPTERRCSPILMKESQGSTANKSTIRVIETLDSTRQQQDLKDFKTENFQNLRKKIFDLDCKTNSSNVSTSKQISSQDKYKSYKSTSHDYHHGKESKHNKSFKQHNHLSTELTKASLPKHQLQTVKVVITEPLPADFKKQHFPTTSTFLPRSSVCHSNLRTLHQVGQPKMDINEAYSPKESWEKYNESHSKQPNEKSTSTAPVFSRLGSKLPEDSPKSKTPGRYTTIPDVLKSPPLSVSDINNLLIESGSDKTLNDISEIGTRRPPKVEDHLNNSFEFIRKKLAQTAKLNSPKREKDDIISSLPNERLALKYNPHPRQERLQSMSSTDGSECSTQSKMNDPRVKLSMVTSQHSPSQAAASNVNVLPTINLSDPRLKRQSTQLEKMPTTPTSSFNSSFNKDFAFTNQSPIIFGRRKDPRVSHIISSDASSSSATTTPFRRMSTTQPQYSSEENWDTDEEEKTRSPIKSNSRLAHVDQHKSESKYQTSSIERSHCDNSNVAFNERETLNQSHLDNTGGKTDDFTNKPCHQVSKKDQGFCKNEKEKKPKNKLATPITFVVPNAPQSDTEEDWDSEPQTTIVTPKPLLSEVPLSPMNNSSLVPGTSGIPPKISPKVFISSKPNSTTAMSPVHLSHMSHVPHIPHIAHVQAPYPLVGSNIHHTFRTQQPQPNRFNSILNDKSERIKYFEAKKQKSVEPRTYKEFREAKERALAQEAAIKRAAEEAEAKKRAKEIKEDHRDTTTPIQSLNEHKVKQIKASKKTDTERKEKKPHKEINKSPAGESTLDKMYRTQNFNTSFPKTNTSFKIPKKKTDEKIKEVVKIKREEKIKSIQTDNSSANIKSIKQEAKQLSLDTAKHHEISLTKDKSIEKVTQRPSATNNSSTQLSKTAVNKMKEKNDFEIKAAIISANKQTENQNYKDPTESKEKHKEHLSDSGMALSEGSKINVRDPRYKPKTPTTIPATEKVIENQEDKLKTLGDVVITSSENQVILKPQQNLEMFNKLNQESFPQPQRILRRRNTMVVFDSAPLVDKEKLRKANALLFEDVQAEEKRKRKQAEEDRLIARRNKNLEEIFKRTDDNCTVSTQNIITGKRRTRATINFNETVNAINVFKHKTIKDTPTSNVTSTPATLPVSKIRTNFKIKLKNLGCTERKNNDESDDDEPLVSISKKEAKSKEPLKSRDSNAAKSLTNKEPQFQDKDKELKSYESLAESKLNTKSIKKCTPINRNSTNGMENNNGKFKSMQNDEEYQNCAISSTSTTDNDNVNENTCSSTSAHKSFKKETDDNEPTSTASKLYNPIPTPEPNEPVLQEIVDQIIKPNSNLEPIFAMLAQILSEEKLAFIKSLIESSNKQNEPPTQELDGIDEAKLDKQNAKNASDKIKMHGNGDGDEEEQEERSSIITGKAGEEKKITTIPKKKRSELDRLNEDIRDMFICNGVLTATGRRMCTMMGKDIASTSSKDINNETSLSPTANKQENTDKKKSDIIKKPITPRTLRRSTRSCKTIDDNDDNESILSRTTEESIDEFNSYNDSSGTDITPIRKMPVLKPQTPIKMPDEVSPKVPKPKEAGKKRKSDGKFSTTKVKNAKPNKDDNKQNSDTDENENDSEAELDESENEGEKIKPLRKDMIVKNTNVHWHNQSKYTTWCMICEKRIPAYASSLHYKTHHRENYISRMAPVILQQYKQGKLSQPLFGVKKVQKQPSWFHRCPFCLKYFNTALSLWLEHFQNHTVEFRYECSKCHRSNNKKLTISRHIKNCEEGATVLTSPVKLNVSTNINAHVCHLCNFIQLKRYNLERHYIEQHQLKNKTIDLLGYTIKLFDVDNVECVNEEKAAEKEKEAWESIEKNEQVIDIDDDDANAITSNSDSFGKKVAAENIETIIIEEHQKEIEDEDEVDKIESGTNFHKLKKEKHQNKVLVQKLINQKDKEESIEKTKPILKKTPKTKQLIHHEEASQTPSEQEKSTKLQKKNEQVNLIHGSNKIQKNDFVVIDEENTAQDLQDELLALAAKAAEEEDNTMSSEDNKEIQAFVTSDRGTINETSMEVTLTSDAISQITSNHDPASEPKTTMSDIISSSIDMLYNRDNEPLEHCTLPKPNQDASNVFMPTRDEDNYSPTIQIFAQSIINTDEHEHHSVKEKPITIAERLSQRFKNLQGASTSIEKCNNSSKTNPRENAFEKLIDDTLFELTKEKDCANETSGYKTLAATTPVTEQPKENVFVKLFSDTVLEFENDEAPSSDNQLMQQQELTDIPEELALADTVTVISDDEDWEDIEITETAPTVLTTPSGNNQKSKSKGLFQKFGIFKTNNNKSKKHLTPMVFLPKKKPKEKSSTATTLLLSPITTTVSAIPAIKTNECANITPSSSNATNLGFKPVINIMDGLFPDSPCNDPIDLVPELAPLEPLQDLNDISSILDSNLSAVNINAADNHTSIEDALDFVSEQQANDKERSNPLSFTITHSQAKTTINNVSHVGYSVQTVGEIGFKFYCLLQNCPFLYSSDSIGLETHFMCEHSQIKWNGYCLMCQSQCFPNNSDASGEYPISKEIRHMMERHANKPILDFNMDSTQNSNSSSHDSDERPKIKLRRLTGDCLSRATPEILTPINEVVTSEAITNVTTPLTMLGALLVADPKPPTKEMPPQLQMPLTEPILLDTNTAAPFRNVSSDFLITSVTSTAPKSNQTALQISSVVSLNNKNIPEATNSDKMQIPKISNVRTLSAIADTMWAQQEIEKERSELEEAAAESSEVTNILQNAQNPSTNRDMTRSENDSPVLIAETLPIAQSKTGDFVVTQTLSAQYNQFSSTALGLNISIAASITGDSTIPAPQSASSSSSSYYPSRQYKCMGSGCKFVSRVPVAMSEHLRFHERRNFSNKHDYLACGFCFYCASDVDDYMKHANQFHIINKMIAPPPSNTSTSTQSESDTATSLTKKIHNILNSKKASSSQMKCSIPNQQSNQTEQQVQDPQEVYLKKLRNTIEEIVSSTGLADDKLYRCCVKNCQSQLTESTFLNHIMYHITTTGGNPNNYYLKCPHCTAQYHRPAGIKAHIKTHARNRYFCYLCDKTSTNPGQILKHFSELHWHTLNMYTKELLPQKMSIDSSGSAVDSSYYLAYTQDLGADEVRKYGEKLILEWQRKKTGSKTHFKSSEIDLLPMMAIFPRQLNCGECKYKTKVRTNMFRHLLMHKQNPGLAFEIGTSSMVDPVNPVPCLNSTERFFDKMTNLASSSIIPSSSTATATASTTKPFKLPQVYVDDLKRYVCGCPNCDYHTVSYDMFRTHLATVHTSETTFTCPFCKEDVCKRGITIDRIMNHTRFHANLLHRCEECNYFHHLRYVVERHINEKHSTMKVNLVTHTRSLEDNENGTMTLIPFAGKKFNSFEFRQTQKSNPATRGTTSESSAPKQTFTPVANTKGRGKWQCDVCGHKAGTINQMLSHCQQQHSVKNQYKCAHCNFGSQQLSQILHHIDETHSGKAREAQTMYHKIFSNNEEVADTRPLWQRNDPTRVRHIRGILMENEEESEEYRKKLALTEDVDNESNEEQQDAVDEEEHDELNGGSYLSGYEFACYHCSFKTQKFEDLKEQHYNQNHNCQQETAKPFWYRLHRRICCPDCRSFSGNYSELQQHLRTKHKKGFYAADIKMAENDDTSQKIACGYCPFHCSTADQLYKHHLKAQHWPQDIRIDNNDQVMEILALGKSQASFQCTLCADIFSNRVAVVQHACDSHAGEESFSFRELSNSLIYRCSSCSFTSTVEIELLRHSIDHYSRFKICSICLEPQSSFNACMQHCYAEHKNKIEKFRTIYPFEEIKKFLLQTLVIFPSGLVLNKRNLINTQYGKTLTIHNLYEDIYKISQQPPIPRLSIARLVARKSIEAQQKTADSTSSSLQDYVFNAMLPRPKPISKRRCTVAFDLDSNQSISSSHHKTKINITDDKSKSILPPQRRTTIDQDQQVVQVKKKEFTVPFIANKISKRRRTVAVDRDTLFSTNLTPAANNLLTELEFRGKKRKTSFSHIQTPLTKYAKEMYPSNIDIEPFSFYGKQPDILDLSKIYTKVAIGGIKTPLTIDKFKLLFNIDCQIKLTKCDEDNQLLVYNDYKHIKKACPASEKLKYD